MISRFLPLFLVAVWACGPLRAAPEKTKSSTVFQVSTLGALSQGVYDASVPMGEVLKRGDFGLGTLRNLDGEVVILNGQAFQIDVSGRVRRVEKREMTPFAVVTRWRDTGAKISAKDVVMAELQTRLESAMKPNLPYAIRIRGEFKNLKLRSVPAQKPPFPVLGEVVAKQTVFQIPRVQGTLVGFRFPKFMAGLNLPGFHFHFLSDDKKQGGHFLSGDAVAASAQTLELREFGMILPRDVGFDEQKLD